MNKKTIQNLIIQGEFKEVFKILLDCPQIDRNEIILLSSRYNQNESNNRMGILERHTYDLVKNQISHSILELIDKINSTPNYSVQSDFVNTPQNNLIDSNSLESKLMITARENQDLRPEIATKTTELLGKLFMWKMTKNLNNIVDINDKIYLEIVESYNELYNKLTLQKKAELQNLADIVNSFLVGVPNYVNLNEAYKLVNSLGFQDNQVRTQLENRIEIDIIKMEIKKKIQAYLTSYKIA
jgi:hypothetical protein